MTSDQPNLTVPSVTIYRCRACGHNHTNPHYCKECHTPVCPKCGRANVIMNITEMKRMVSDAVPTPQKKGKRKGNKSAGRPRKSQLASLLEKVNEMESEKKDATNT